MNQQGFFGLGGRADLLDLGPGSPNDGLSLAAPSWGVPEEPRIEILHGTTTLAFKVRTQPPSWAESGAPRPSWSPSGTGARGGPGHEAQAEARASCPDLCGFAASFAPGGRGSPSSRRRGWGGVAVKWEKEPEAAWDDS